MTFNYKKNKLEQLKGFCAVVECADSVNDAAIKSCISATTISKQISSLEQDLGFLLFDRIKNKLVLNEKGKAYYKEAKRILLDLDKIYGGKIGIRKISRIEMFLLTIKKKYLICKRNVVDFLKKMIIKITWKTLLTSLAFVLLGIWLYLYKTNWFFDRKLYKLADPLLREVMEQEYYRIPKTYCPPEVVQWAIDWNRLFIKFIDKSYKINMTHIYLYNSGGTIFKMNGSLEVDNVFNTDQQMSCDKDRRFKMKTEEASSIRELLRKNNNLKSYILVREKVGDLNKHILEENLLKYKNQLYLINAKSVNLENGSFVFAKYKNYYYMFLETNGKEAGVDLHHQQERYLIFKKLTLNELMHYDNGSYWKVIKEYNIKID